MPDDIDVSSGERSAPRPERWEPPPYLGGGWGSTPDEGNSPAVVGFSVAAVAGSLLILSFGLLSPATLPAGLVGAVFARRGRGRLAQGKTREHAGLARYGVWIGLATAALSLVALGLWIAYIAANGTSGGGDVAAR